MVYSFVFQAAAAPVLPAVKDTVIFGGAGVGVAPGPYLRHCGIYLSAGPDSELLLCLADLRADLRRILVELPSSSSAPGFLWCLISSTVLPNPLPCFRAEFYGPAI